MLKKKLLRHVKKKVAIAEHLLFRYDERLRGRKRVGAISGGAMRRLSCASLYIHLVK